MSITTIHMSTLRSAAKTLINQIGEEIEINDPSNKVWACTAPDVGPVLLATCGTNSTKQLRRTVTGLREYSQQRFGLDAPIIIVMGYIGKKIQHLLEKELKVFWMDMSTNGYIDLPHTKIRHYGTPNRYAKDRTHDNPTTPAATRVMRLLLLNNGKIRVNKLADLAGVDKGLVSRIMTSFRINGWVKGQPGQAGEYTEIIVTDPEAILKYWRARHSFTHHRTEVLSGHIKDPDVGQITEILNRQGYDHAWTMMPAAWAYGRFGEFDHYAFYLKQDPLMDLQDYLGMSHRKKSKNVWIIVAGRPDTWDDIVTINEIPYVDPFRTYVDLKECPDPRQSRVSKQLKDFIKTRLIQGK